jgi:hypothetical protein
VIAFVPKEQSGTALAALSQSARVRRLDQPDKVRWCIAGGGEQRPQLRPSARVAVRVQLTASRTAQP